MRKVDRLIRQAREAAIWRGHKMQMFIRGKENKHLSNSWCAICRAGVQVNTNPAPNEIDIGGEAVALNCPVKPGDNGDTWAKKHLIVSVIKG